MRLNPKTWSGTTLAVVVFAVMVVTALVFTVFAPEAPEACDQVGRITCVDSD